MSALREHLSFLGEHRELLLEMTRRDVRERYLGQVFGSLWAVGHPLVLMIIYVFVFAFIFRMKIGGTRELPLDYTTYLLAGIVPWLSFQEAMTKATTVVHGNANLVQQVVFPIEVLPVKTALAALVPLGVSLVLIIAYVLFTHGSLHWTYALLPVVILMQTMAMVGTAYVLSSVGVYFKDTKDFVQVFCAAGLFLLPIFYLPEAVPAALRPILYINPFSYLIWCYQDVLYFGRFEHWWAWIVLGTMSFGVFHFGYRMFRHTKSMFANVL